MAVQILQKIYFSCLNILITGFWKTYLPLTSKILRLKIPLGIYGFTAIELGQDCLSVTYNLPDLLLWLRFLNREIVWMQEAIRLGYHWSSLHCARLDCRHRSRGLFIQFVRTQIFMLISDPACD